MHASKFVSALLLATAGTTFWNTDDPPLSAARATPPVPRDFTHTKHVTRQWMKGDNYEVLRDCRGCHVFPADGGPDKPQQLCKNCHETPEGSRTDQGANFDLVSAAGWSSDMRPQRTSISRLFYHDEHLVLSCRQCHDPRTGDAQDEIPAHMPIPSSSLSCEECHAEEVTEQRIAEWEFVGRDVGRDGPPEGLTPEELKKAFGGINDGRIRPAEDEPPRPFAHSDHMPNPATATEQDCLVCHQKIKTSGHSQPELEDITSDSCGKCHLGAGGAPLESRMMEVQRNSPSFHTFAHVDHYGFDPAEPKSGICNTAAYEQLKGDTNSCAQCHSYQSDSQEFEAPDFPFQTQEGVHTYAGCRTCHDPEAWGTFEGLHESDNSETCGWHKPTDGTSPGACTSCHQFGSGSMLTNRPMTDVTRPTGNRFTFTGNAHPDISTLGNSRANRQALADCKECHRAEGIEQLLSRIKQRTFRHDVHLSAKPTSQECLTCHTDARSTGKQVFDTTNATYEKRGDKGCKSCHLGATVEELPSTRDAKPRAVPRFGHQDHESIECSKCHEIDAAEGANIKTLSSSNCKDCHNHAEDKQDFKHTGNIKGSDVQSCARCHTEDAGGVPNLRANLDNGQFTVTLQMFDFFKGDQHHPIPGEKNYQSCNECHKKGTDAKAVRRVSSAPAHFKLDAKTEVHNNSAYLGEEQACFGCHWRRPDNAGNHENGRKLLRESAKPEFRDKYGSAMNDYPGEQALGKLQS